MKSKLIIIIGSILGLFFIISCFVYFVSGVSETYPAIKKYEYSGSFKQLMSHIHSYASIDSNLIVKITDKVGTKKDGYATYVSINIRQRSNIEYSIECEEINTKKSTKTTISLVEAYDKTQNSGGYTKKAKGVEPLINNFDINFIMPLRRTQNIKITSLE